MSTEHEDIGLLVVKCSLMSCHVMNRIALEVETKARVTPAHAGSAGIVRSPKRNVLHDAADLPTRTLGRHLGDYDPCRHNWLAASAKAFGL